VLLLGYVFERRPRVPFAERHKVENVGHGFYRGQVRLGFMQTPDIPRTLENFRLLGFDGDLDQKHYYVAHETIVRREKGSAMGRIPFAIFSFLSKIASRAPDYFKIPNDGVIEVGFRIEI
jgi:KUP system potassium uptake protein